MFRKKMWQTLFLITPLFFLFLYQLVVIRPSDILFFEKAVRKQELAVSKPACSENQHRKQVRKDLWLSQNDHSRLHYRIASDSSILTLTPVKNKIEVIETLYQVKSLMQDKLSINGQNESTQQVKLIEAKDGRYHHGLQEFTANQVVMSLFNLPGHSLPREALDHKSAFLQGMAKRISFLFSGKAPQFYAEQFEATVVKK